MKKLFLSLLLLLTVTVVWAQVPQQISYQSLIRDGNNVVVASSPIGIKISLLQGTATGPAVYVETHSKTTNANGLVSLEIGTGTVLSGSFASIDWANGPYLIQTETDPTGGVNYSIPVAETQEVLVVEMVMAEDGAYNTNLMTDSPAAEYVASLGSGWYLPSIDELNLLFNNRFTVQKALRAGNNTLIEYTFLYWSSTEFSVNNAFVYNFGNGYGTNVSKHSGYAVRGVKSF
uniref:hypothetical protein n=1 Tax=Algoriphagus sp. TaxID=1872435 RepID=UPI004048C571